MIIVLVEHYLTDEGRKEFPEWIDRVRVIVKEFEGYISLKHLIDVQNEARSLLELRFESLELLRKWSKSEAHDKAILELLEVRVKKQYSQIFKYP